MGFIFLLNLLMFSFVYADEVYILHKVDTVKYPEAKCLDGSPGAFWYHPGYGSGIDKFKIHFQGGGWCINTDDCYARSLTTQGSSNTWESMANCDQGSQAAPCVYDGNEGLSDKDAEVNPVAYNWNKLFIGYCDGASYSGHVLEPAAVLSTGNQSEIHFKGRYLLDAIFDTFLHSSSVQMNKAKEVIISGTSAGGLAVYLHTDYLREKIVSASTLMTPPRVAAVADAGFFMNLPSIYGTYLYSPNYQHIFEMQNVSDSVNADCISYYRQQSSSNSDETWKCFMAEYTLPFIKTDLFISNSFVDSWQGSNIMGITDCNPSAGDCSPETIDYMNDFRLSMLTKSALGEWLVEPSSGAWLCTCWTHPLVNWNHWWVDVKVQGYSQGDVFKNWYNRETKDNDVPWVAINGEWGSNQC
jgi:hypothetical protein